jgi:hypothetical protein
MEPDCFVTTDGKYYEGDRQHGLDTQVPRRPSYLHVWDANNGWTIDQVAKQSADSAAAAEKEKEDDLAALRSMRKVLAVVSLPLGTAPDVVAAQVALKE